MLLIKYYYYYYFAKIRNFSTLEFLPPRPGIDQHQYIYTLMLFTSKFRKLMYLYSKTFHFCFCILYINIFIKISKWLIRFSCRTFNDILSLRKSTLNLALVSFFYFILMHPALKMQKWCNKELLDKCDWGNKIPPLWYKCRVKRRICADGVQFYCASHTYPAIVLLVLYFIA